MGKRNQITADLRINAEAQLKNSKSFISQLEKMTDKFDFGEKINNQILDAQQQLKGFNKVLEKLQGKSVISDDELKNLVKAGKEIANVITKTEKLYSGMSTNELQKYSKAYIAQVKAQEEAALKIKQEYQAKTGKVYDKEIKNLDKYENKIIDLQKQIKALNDSKDDTIDAAIKKENARLQEQFDLLQKIKKTQAELKNAKDSIYADSSASTGFSEKELKSKVNTNRVDVAKDVANSEYKNLLNTYQAISKEKDEILKSTTDALEIEKALIQLANQYGLVNIRTTEEFEEQLKALERQKNFYRLLQNRGQLATEEKVTAEIERRNALLREQKRIADAIAAAQGNILGDNDFDSTKQMNSQARNAREALNGKNVQLSIDGASLTEDGEDNIATQISNSIRQSTDRLVAEEKKAQKEYDELKEPMDKLATQSERMADEQDLKTVGKTINEHTDKDGENTRQQIIKSQAQINALSATGKEVSTHGKEALQSAAAEGTISDIVDIIPLSGQITQTDVDAKNKAVKLQTKFDEVYSEANRYMEMLGQEMTSKEYHIVSEQAVEQLKEARKLVNEISSIVKGNIRTRKDELNEQREQMIAHDSQGRRRYDENKDPILKKGYSLEAFDELIGKQIDYEEILGHVNDVQTAYNIKITQAENAVYGLKERSEEEIKIKKQSARATEEQSIALRQLSKPAQQTALAMQKNAEQVQYLGSAFDDIKNKIGYFLSLNYVFDAMTQKIREAIQTTREMDKDMTQIGLVLGKSSTQVWKNFDTYANMAERLNTTTSQVTNSMKLFYQQGLNTSEVNKMVEASAIAAALGESTMAEASETLTSIINSYNLSANEAMMVTDKISQIAIVSAADFGELSTAIEKVASSAASAGLDLDHMMGYLGKMIETTREAPTNIGTALKTIVANFTQFKEDPTGLNEEGTEINKVDKALKSVGISLTNANGEVRDLGEVLDELGGIWETLNRSQKAYLATQIAGTRQQSRFYALMNDYERTLELVAEGSNSAGKAQEQFGLYTDSLEASTNRLTNQWEKFFNSITAGNGVIKIATDGLTALMKVINSIGPIGTALGLSTLIVQLRKGINNINFFKEGIDQLQNSKRGLQYFQTAESKINAVKNTNLLTDDEKAERIHQIKAKTANFAQQHNLPNVLGKTDAISKVIDYRKQVELLNTKIELQPKVLQKVKLTGQKAWTQVKMGALQAKNAVGALGKAIGTALLQTGVIFVVSKALEGLAKIRDALVVTAEEYQERMSEHQSNADTIEGLTEEYATLSRKVNKTAEEEKRLKEITKEVTAVDEKLGKQLEHNASMYEVNIKAMQDYAKEQNKLAASNAAKAIMSDNSLWDSFWDSSVFGEGFWADQKAMWTFDTSEQDALKNSRFNTWRNLASAKGTSAGLDSDLQEMLDLYMANIIDTNQWLDAEAIMTKTGQIEDKIDEFIVELQNLTKEERNIFTELKTFETNDENSYRDYYNKVQSSNLPERVKNQLLSEIQGQSVDIYNNVDGNNYISDPERVYEKLVTELSKNNIAKLLNTNLSTLDEQEKKDYQADMAKLTSEKNVDEFLKKFEIGGEAFEEYITQMRNSGEITDSTAEALIGLKTAAESLDKTLKALESFSDIVESTLKEGGLKQTEILEKLANGKIGLGDIQIHTTNTSQNPGSQAMNYQHSFMTVDTKSMVATAMAGVEEFLAPMAERRDQLKAEYENHQNAPQADYDRVAQEETAAQNKVNELQEQLKTAKATLENERGDYLIRDSLYGGLTTPIGWGMDFVNMIGGNDVVGDFEAAQASVESLEKQLEEANAELETAKTATANAEQAVKDLADETTDVGKAFKEEGDYIKEQAESAEEAYDAMKKLMTLDIQPMADFSAVFDQFQVMGQVNQELQSLQQAWDMVAEGQQNYRDVAAMIAADPSLINAIDMEAEHLRFSDEALEAHAKNVLQTELQSINAKIRGTEAILALLQGQAEGSDAWKNATNEDIASAMAYNNEMLVNKQDTTEDEGTELSQSSENYAEWGNAVQRAYQAVEQARVNYIKGLNSESETNYLSSITDLKGVDLKGSGSDAPTINKDDIEATKNQILGDAAGDDGKTQEMIKRYQDQLTILRKIKGGLEADINNVGGLFKRNSSAPDGGGGEDEYEGMIEKLEHFYNYLRQIEALEAKINKLRERRNLIDATENYYVDDLIEENKLLKEQATLYGNYINDEIEYLAVLRNQLSSAYSDWVYFNDEGVVQVKQTEFHINSEEEEERYNAFAELLEEYKTEYNTMLENQNTLYTIQATIVENINSSYDKILKRITDVAEQLEYINSISEHWVEMSFGSIEKLPLLNDQIKTTADMLLNAQKGVNELNGDFDKLNKTIQNSDFTSLLTWDEELGHYKVNNEAMVDPKVREQFEAQGYNWAEVETWVNATAAASQKITASVKETNTELMNARAQLKDLLEERISTISEIFEKATEEINKFYGIYEKKIEALGTENDLFGTKSENIDAQYDYLMTVAGHSKALLESLKKNNQDILDTLTTDYADYVDMIDGVAYINKMAIEESDTLTEAQKADLLQLYQLYYESQDQIEEVNDKFYDYISQIEELERAKRDAIIDLKNQLHDELIAKDQEEIDELSEKYDKMSALDNEYYSQLQQRINDARDARSRLQNQQDLAQMQNRLSVLQRDNSGQYNSELVELQRQINERLQAQADQNIDLEMERIAREQQQREEDRQMQITQMENLLTFKDENGMYWEMAQDIINNGTASVIGTLMSSKESEDQSDEARKQQLEDLQDTTEMAAADLGSGQDYMAENFRESLEKYVKTPIDELDIPGIVLDNANTVADQIAHGTQVFINTMSGLFRLLNEANGKTEAGGYTTGLLDDNGIYTPPTKKPVEPPPAPSTTPSNSTSSAPKLEKGAYVDVKPGTKWYYDSYGTSPTGNARSGKIKYINLKGSRPYNIEGLGWIRKEDIVGYNKGGYVDYTGIAAVHGKAGKPEAFLNAKQTALFETLRDALVRVPNINSKDTDNSENITIENLTIDVKELADTDSVDKIVRTVKQSIYKDATSGNNMKINRR